MRTLKYIFMCVCMAVAATSCDDDEEGYAYGDFFYDLVTYTGDNGSNAVFTYRSYNDSPLITLVADNLSSVDAPAGQRMMLNYVVSGEMGEDTKLVTVKGLSKVNTDTVVVIPRAVIDTLKREPVKIESVWRTGEYLNVRCQVQYTEEPRRMFLASDGTADADGVMECFQIQDLLGAASYYWLETYFSYYIEPVWSVSDCTAIRYNVNDLSYPDVKYYEFKKE